MAKKRKTPSKDMPLNTDVPEKHIKELRQIVKKDKKKYAELRQAFQNASSDDQRIGLIQGAVLTDAKLRKFQPKPGGSEAAATTVTIVVVTVTITWPSTANREIKPGELVSKVKKVRKSRLKTAKTKVRTRPKAKK